MTTQTQPNSTQAVPTQIKTPAAQTLELLTRIAVALETLQDSIGHLIEISDSTAEHAANTAEALARFGQAMASGPAPAPAAAAVAGQTVVFLADTISLGYDDNGKATYKVKGGQYTKFGVRVWPEVLPKLGIDPAALKPGPNEFGKPVIALVGEKGPQKVIGLAN